MAAALVAACGSKPSKPGPDPLTDSGLAAALPSPAVLPGDAVHGKELVQKFECNRCHEGTGMASATREKACVQCHSDITEGRFDAPPATLAKWKPRVKDLTEVPSLTSLGERVQRSWLEGYLLKPTDLRPHLKEYMPRLAISPTDAKDIAAYLVPTADAPVDLAKAPELAGADLGKGRQLLDTKGCGSCHTMTGVAAILASSPPAMNPKDFAAAFTIAPDLRVIRDRMTPKKLVAWLTNPHAVKPDTKMPNIALTTTEVRDLAGYLMTAELAAAPRVASRERLPVLTRKVTYKEVDTKVFHRTCWHCHSEPDYAIGDGGPGNSGGFGFKPRGLNLSAYSGIAAGYLDDGNVRQNVFAKDKDGVPRLVKALLARHDEEEQGAPTGEVRGMPLGYDALSMEDIQLVDTWVSQGRPQ